MSPANLDRSSMELDPELIDPELTPAAAATMKEIYGSHNGFGWKLNEIIGARIVTVPANIVFQMANNNLVVMLASLACIFLLTHA